MHLATLIILLYMYVEDLMVRIIVPTLVWLMLQSWIGKCVGDGAISLRTPCPQSFYTYVGQAVSTGCTNIIFLS